MNSISSNMNSPPINALEYCLKNNGSEDYSRRTANIFELILPNFYVCRRKILTNFLKCRKIEFYLGFELYSGI